MLHFKEQKINAMEQIPSYTAIEFLSICGGLLGLFLGVSVLSIVEFIYYFSLRFYWKLHTYMKNRRKVAFKRYVRINRMTISTIDSVMCSMKWGKHFHSSSEPLTVADFNMNAIDVKTYPALFFSIYVRPHLSQFNWCWSSAVELCDSKVSCISAT